MKKMLLVFVASFTLLSSQAWAATVRLDLTWSVVGTPTVPATHYRVDELVSGAWVVRTTVTAPTLTYSISGRAVGISYSFSVMPLNGAMEGTRSNTTVCGTVAAPDTTLTFSCTPVVVP